METESKTLSTYELFGYHPTLFQKEFHRFRRRQPNTTLVAHRRFGKTECNLIELFDGAIRNDKRLPIYQYIAPTLKQAKQISWDKLKFYANTAKRNGFRAIDISETDTKVILYHRGRANPSTIQLCGWEEPDSLRGPYTDGMVIDEAADMKVGIWGSILAPRLSDRKGWSSITGTVKGINQFYDFYQKGNENSDTYSKYWGSLYYPISLTTGKIPWLDEEALEILKSGMTVSEWRQEMELDWDASCPNKLITLDVVREALRRSVPLEIPHSEANVLGVDVARFGEDATTLVRRHGNVVFTPEFIKKQDGNYIANRIMNIDSVNLLDAVMVDGTGGYGASVVDALRALNCPFPVFEIVFNGKATDEIHYYNKRSEMWDDMRDYLCRRGRLPVCDTLERELSSVQFSYEGTRLKLEDKEAIRKRTGKSPDAADALALTFAVKVYPSNRVVRNSSSGGAKLFSNNEFTLGIG